MHISISMGFACLLYIFILLGQAHWLSWFSELLFPVSVPGESGLFSHFHTHTHPRSLTHTLTHTQPALRTLRTLRSGKLLAPNFTYTTVATIRACTVLRFRRRRAADPAVYPHIYRRSCGPVANHRSKHVSKKWPIQSYIEACVAAGPITYPSRYRRSCGPVANCAVVDDSDVSSRAFSITYPCFGSGHITPSWQVLSG